MTTDTSSAVREINADEITAKVAALCQSATHFLPEDVVTGLERARDSEQSELGKQVLLEILENVDIAKNEQLPLCQDTGTTVVIVELGQDVHVVGGSLTDAINAGVAKGYTEGYLRASMVDHPFSSRVNTKDNTPAVMHIEVVPGDKLRLKILPKGGGCENMSAFKVFLPSAGTQPIVDFVLRTIVVSGGNPCPPLDVRVGAGGIRHDGAVAVVIGVVRDAVEVIVRDLDGVERPRGEPLTEFEDRCACNIHSFVSLPLRPQPNWPAR